MGRTTAAQAPRCDPSARPIPEPAGHRFWQTPLARRIGGGPPSPRLLDRGRSGCAGRDRGTRRGSFGFWATLPDSGSTEGSPTHLQSRRYRRRPSGGLVTRGDPQFTRRRLSHRHQRPPADRGRTTQPRFSPTLAADPIHTSRTCGLTQCGRHRSPTSRRTQRTSVDDRRQLRRPAGAKSHGSVRPRWANPFQNLLLSRSRCLGFPGMETAAAHGRLA